MEDLWPVRHEESAEAAAAIGTQPRDALAQHLPHRSSMERPSAAGTAGGRRPPVRAGTAYVLIKVDKGVGVVLAEEDEAIAVIRGVIRRRCDPSSPRVAPRGLADEATPLQGHEATAKQLRGVTLELSPSRGGIGQVELDKEVDTVER